MKASEAIKALQKIIEEDGDLEMLSICLRGEEYHVPEGFEVYEGRASINTYSDRHNERVKGIILPSGKTWVSGASGMKLQTL